MKVTWDQVGERLYKIGIDRGVLYSFSGGDYLNGVAWNGLTEVSDNSGGMDKTVLYTNDVKSRLVFTKKETGGSINAYCYPDEFEPCIGIAPVSETITGFLANDQEFAPFGLCYRTFVGNDVEGTDHAYELHLIYNAYVVSTGSGSYSTLSSDMSVDTMSWDFEAIPVEIGDLDPSAEFVIDSRRITPEKLSGLEDILYGTAETEPRLPYPEELMEYLEEE